MALLGTVLGWALLGSFKWPPFSLGPGLASSCRQAGSEASWDQWQEEHSCDGCVAGLEKHLASWRYGRGVTFYLMAPTEGQGFGYVELLYRILDLATYYVSLMPQMISRIKQQYLLAVHVLRERYSFW